MLTAQIAFPAVSQNIERTHFKNGRVTSCRRLSFRAIVYNLHPNCSRVPLQIHRGVRKPPGLIVIDLLRNGGTSYQGPASSPPSAASFTAMPGRQPVLHERRHGASGAPENPSSDGAHERRGC